MRNLTDDHDARRSRAWRWTPPALLAALLLAVPLLATPAEAQPRQTSYPGEAGTIVERDGDDLITSLRYRGAHRFDTARLIAEDTYETAPDVLLARADLFPDALAGSYLAGQLEAPLLLTESDRLTPDTAASLDRLDAQRVTVLGETAAISDATVAELEGEGYVVERVGGADRFATAREAATAEGTTTGEREGEGATAIVARADDFPDALVAGSVSYAAAFPLLLTTGDTLHADATAALTELDIDHVIIPGGTAAISDDVESDIEGLGITTERVSGVDRVATSVEFANFARDELGFSLDHVNMALGLRFPDALTLGPHAGDEAHPIVLTATPTELGGAGTVSGLLSETCEVSLLHVAGGHAAISSELEQQMRQEATSTGAICEVAFDEDDAFSVNPPGTEHEVSAEVTDNAGGTPDDEADVRFQVFRGDLELGDAEVSLSLEEDTAVTTEDGTATFAYDGPDEDATDYIVACTEPITGDDPGTCVEDVAGEDVLVVLDGEPQNVRDDVAADTAVKEWDEAVAADPATLQEALFCDAAGLLEDPLEPCEPYDHFGDDTGDFLQLTFDGALTPIADVETEASITLTSDGDEVTFTPGDGVAFITATEVDQIDLDDEILDELGNFDDINENQLLVIVEDVLSDTPLVSDATDELVVRLTGVEDVNGQEVQVPDTAIDQFDTELLDL